ncbi:MAG TPA: hypothetical protein VIV11_08145 [Kofleriaceae bacterium]
MFRCDVCGLVTPPRTPCNRIVVETRPIEYPKRDDAHWHPPRAGGKGKWVDDPGGTGTAIVREVRACPACAAQLHARERDEDPLRRRAA